MRSVPTCIEDRVFGKSSIIKLSSTSSILFELQPQVWYSAADTSTLNQLSFEYNC
jgi:hypothetical protein